MMRRVGGPKKCIPKRLDREAAIEHQFSEGKMLEDRKSHMHTHNPAHKIPEAVDLHTSNQGPIGYVGELAVNIGWRVAILRGAARA